MTRPYSVQRADDERIADMLETQRSGEYESDMDADMVESMASAEEMETLVCEECRTSDGVTAGPWGRLCPEHLHRLRFADDIERGESDEDQKRVDAAFALETPQKVQRARTNVAAAIDALKAKMRTTVDGAR